MPLSRPISRYVMLCLEGRKIRLYLMSGSERLAISHPLRGVEACELESRHYFVSLSR